MKNYFLKIFFLIITLSFSVCFAIDNINESMSINDFLLDNDSKKWKKLDLNSQGVVTYKNKIILNYNGVPLSDDTSFYDNELLMIIHANKIKPRFGCNPKNIKKNGTMGCYIDNPDK